MKKGVFLILGLILILGSFCFVLKQPAPAKYQGLTLIHIGSAEVKVQVADTSVERMKGLSGQKSLEEGTGMFFIFDKPVIQGFWMKDMLFSIDIVWIDEDLKIVGIEKAVSPTTFPKIFYSPAEIRYVLELPAEYSEKNGIDTGDKVYFEEKI